MTTKRLALIVFITLCTLCAIQALYFYPRLPAMVASHFDLSGRPDGWSSKNVFVTLYLLVSGGCAGLFLGFSCTISKLPAELINLPNKDYWLSTSRRAQTNAFLSHAILWFGSATMLLLLDIFHQSFQVHIGKADSLSHPTLSLGLFIGFTFLWCIRLFSKFSCNG